MLRVPFLLVALWSVIYLPWLGTPELRSEEGHRVLPAVEMLESGDYLVPHIGGAVYLRKPPLINWIVAGAFGLTGTRDEWSARLPSAFAVLLVALAFVFVGGRQFGRTAAGSAGAAWLTSYGIIEKGRMIEIDAVYVALFALAFVVWLACWQGRRSPWLTWMVPWIFLGLDLLAKGPAHLFFFYALVVAILWQSRRLRDLIHPAHGLGLVVMLAIFFAWAVPAFAAVTHDSISSTWWRELRLRVTGGENDATDWPMNFPHGVGFFLPWVFLLPFIRSARLANNHRAALARGLVLGGAVPFVVTLLLPGTIPRYVLPTVVPAALLLGLALEDRAFAWRSSGFWKLSLSVAGLLALVGAIGFPLRSATFLKHRPKVKPIAATVNAAIPRGETLYAVDPLFQPYLFYIRERVRYVPTLAELPAGARYFLTLPAARAQVENDPALALRHPRVLVATPEYRGHATLLFRVDDR